MEQSKVQFFNKDNETLNITFCGHSATEPLHSFGPAVRPVYIIHFIHNGKGFYTINDHTYTLQKGQGFLIEPDILTYYISDKEDPWEYSWIAFDGTYAQTLMTKIGLSSKAPTFQSVHNLEIKEIMNSLLLLSSNSTSDSFKRFSLFYSFLSLINHDIYQDNGGIQQDSTYIQNAIDYIKNNYYITINVEDIAQHIGISRNYLYKIFVKNLQITPHKYLTTYRMTKAAELLACTHLTVENIAYSCGYQDISVFSRAFKTYMSLSPRNYRLQMNKIK